MDKNYVIKIQNGKAHRYDTHGAHYNTYSYDNVVSGLIQNDEVMLTLKDGHVKVLGLGGTLKRSI
jgi:hypothetical protein